MKKFTERRVNCPHCGFSNALALDGSNGDQEFYHDCSACCNPIHLRLMVDDLQDRLHLEVDADDEQIF